MNSNNDYKFENQHSNKAEGFKFAVTLLIIFGYINHFLYNYFQNNVVPFFTFLIIYTSICIFTILIIGLIVYIILKGYSMEVRESDRKQNLNDIASIIYFIIFLIFIGSITYTLGGLILLSFYPDLKNVPDSLYLLLPLISFGFIIVFIYPPSIKNLLKKIKKFEDVDIIKLVHKFNCGDFKLRFKVKNFLKKIFSSTFKDYIIGYIYNKFIKTALIFILTFFCILLIVNFSPQIGNYLVIFNGSINVDMENIYQKNDIMIPIQIQVTGVDIPISVDLFKVEPNNSRSIAKIDLLGTQMNDQNENYLGIFDNVSNFKNDNCLLGNGLGSGKYILFINTTNLTIGYYKLEIKSGKTTSGDGFFLMDNTSILLN